MKVEELDKLVEQGTDAMTVKRVFGEPIVHDGVTLIPVAGVRGLGGMGKGEGPDEQGKGEGSGFAMTAKAMGTYVIKGDKVRFVPAVDVNRLMATLGFVIAAIALFIGRPLVKALTAK